MLLAHCPRVGDAKMKKQDNYVKIIPSDPTGINPDRILSILSTISKVFNSDFSVKQLKENYPQLSTSILNKACYYLQDIGLLYKIKQKYYFPKNSFILGMYQFLREDNKEHALFILKKHFFTFELLNDIKEFFVSNQNKNILQISEYFGSKDSFKNKSQLTIKRKTLFIIQMLAKFGTLDYNNRTGEILWKNGVYDNYVPTKVENINSNMTISNNNNLSLDEADILKDYIRLKECKGEENINKWIRLLEKK